MKTKMRQISFEVSVADQALIDKIVDRAIAEGIVRGDPRGARVDLQMDLSATHANGCPLDFEELYQFGRGDFGHDISGIIYHLDRRTGELGECFVPRCARRQVALHG